MIPRLKEARHTEGYRVWLRFRDGLEGEVDLADELLGDVFEPLKDPSEFIKLKADPELHTLVWPNGADFAPEFLYEMVKNQKGDLSPIGETVQTGEVCPASGIWETLDEPKVSAPIAIGNRMPPRNGRAVEWRLAERAA